VSSTRSARSAHTAKKDDAKLVSPTYVGAIAIAPSGVR
jgi:hypothetical protein